METNCAPSPVCVSPDIDCVDSNGPNLKYSSPLGVANGQSDKQNIPTSVKTYVDERNFDNVNIHNKEYERKGKCLKHITTGYNTYEELEEVKRQVHGLRDLQLHDAKLLIQQGDLGFHGNLKTRSRIKTNPWLPSPRSTPRTTPCSSVNTSPDVSPDDPKDTIKRFDDSDCLTVDSGVKGSSDSLSSYRSNRKLWERSLSDSSLHRSFTSENSLSPNETEPSLNIEASSSENITPDVVKKLTNQKPGDRVSFEYEEAFENQIEAHVCAYRTRDEFSDGYGSDDDVFLDSKEMKKRLECQLQKKLSEKRSRSQVVESSSDEEEDPLWRRRDEFGSAGDTDDTLIDGAGRDAVFLAYDSPIREAIDSTLAAKTPVLSPTCASMECESIDSALESATSSLDGTTSMIDSGHFSMENSMEVPSERTVSDIRSSLQSKVNQLRREKAIVDEKIRQAQEEERLRVQERMRFQKQLTLHRKQMLLRTLADLKSKLEHQSERLQTSYSSVLGMQRAAVRSRQQGWAVRMDEKKETTFWFR